MNLNSILPKIFKFVTFVIFTFMALVYFGVLLLVPLDIITQITKLFHAMGLPTVLSAGIGIAAMAYIGLAISKMPELYKLILDIGMQLVNFGHTQIKRFDVLTEQAGGSSAS